MGWVAEAARIVRVHCEGLNHGMIAPCDLTTRQLCTLYYVTSMVYYVYDDEILKDIHFEEICKELKLREFDEWIYDKPDKESLEAGTGYSLKYSTAIKQITEEILQ